MIAKLKTVNGEFDRTESSFRNRLTADGSAAPTGEGDFAAEPGRYHLYVSYACPWAHRTLIFRKTIYDTINNRVYRAGFARSQRAYDAAYERLFNTLDELEDRLSRQRYLVGNQISEADWRLFTTWRF